MENKRHNYTQPFPHRKKAMISTKLTKAIGVKYPIIQGGMHHVGLAPLAGAVSKAGGLGIITALSLPNAEAFRAEIRKAREIAGKGNPIGVNLTLLPTLAPPDYDSYLNVVVEEGVPVIETAGHINGLQKFVSKLKAEGRFVIHKCTSVRHAKSAQKIGVDMISMDGFECAGHPGETDIPNWVLLNQAAMELDIPFVASGGCATGRQLAAAIALGAEGMNMGTRFMCTKEAPVHENIKQAIIDAGVDQTTLVMRTMRNTERVYNNDAAKQVLAIEKQFPGDFSKVKHLVAGSVYKQVFQETGDVKQGIWSAGVCMGLIHNAPTCDELIQSIMNEAVDVIKNRMTKSVV